MIKSLRIGAVSALLCIPGLASAALTNAGFEGSPDLTGWTDNTTNSQASVVTSHLGFGGTTYNPKEGAKFLAITVDVSVDNIWDQWQEVVQTVSLTANETISGWAAFDWGDSNAFLPESRDGARVQIRQGTSVIATPFDEDGTDGGGRPDQYDGPWTQWSFTAPNAGSYTVAYGVVNTFDDIAPSYGLFDAVATQTPPPPPPPGVPEPTALALLGLGLAGLGAARRRQKA